MKRYYERLVAGGAPLACLICVLLCPRLFAQPNNNDITGIWLDQDKRGYIQIFKDRGVYYGRAAGSTTSEVALDVHNPDPGRRSVSLLGLCVMQNLQYDGAGHWAGGTIYNPDDGRTYSLRLALPEPDVLEVRGYLGILMLGKTQKWTRVRNADATGLDAATGRISCS